MSNILNADLAEVSRGFDDTADDDSADFTTDALNMQATTTAGIRELMQVHSIMAPVIELDGYYSLITSGAMTEVRSTLNSWS